MNYVGKLLSNFKGFYSEINSATLTGAIDVLIVQQQDGSYVSSPFHVRFGKMGVLRSREKVVDIEINGQPVDLHMKLGEAGEAFFVQKTDDEALLPDYLATSPINSEDSLELMEKGLQELRMHSEKHPVSLHRTHSEVLLGEHLSLPSDTLTVRDPLIHAMSAGTLTIPHCSNIGIQTNLTGHDVEIRATQTNDTATVSEVHLKQRHLSENSAVTKSNIEFPAAAISDDSPVSAKGKDSPRQKIKEVVEQARTTVLSRRTKRKRRKQAEHQSNVHCPPVTSNASQQTSTHSGSPVQSSLRVLSPSGSPKVAGGSLENRDGSPKGAANSPKASTTAFKATFSIGSPGSKGSDAARGSPKCTSDNELGEEVMFDLEMSESEEDLLLPVMSVGRTVSMPLIDSTQQRVDEWANSQYASHLHPFSDGDLTPITSPIASRPPSPKSDTEIDIQKNDQMAQTLLTGDDMQNLDTVTWHWGQLPQNTCDVSPNKTPDEEKPSGGLLSFMRSTRKLRHQPEQEGITLDQLRDQMDPEIAALYLYPKTTGGAGALNEEDTESGRGASLPQSPVTVGRDPTSIAGIHRPMPLTPHLSFPDVMLSLCGGLKESDTDVSQEKFHEHLVTFDEFCRNPQLLTDVNLVLKVADKYYNWQTAAPILLSLMAYQTPLPDGVVDSIVKQHMPKKERGRRWIWWGRGEDNPVHRGSTTTDIATSTTDIQTEDATRMKKIEMLVSDDDSEMGANSQPPTVQDSSQPATSGEVKELIEEHVRHHYRKSLKLTSEQIAELHLEEGSNEIEFSVTTQYQGTSRCSSNVFLWKWDDQIIISDIDGTITKSDVLGQILPMVGKDWSQAGIAQLYDQISKNGYRFLYLSARAIGQSRITREYITGIRQGSLALPEGPLLLSPSSLISAFHKEVIERKPEEFKISCLRDIASLFPDIPFYSGFGNKINDVWAYRAVGIPKSRIFTVNPRGELKMSHAFQTTYTKLNDIVDHCFPPLLEDNQGSGKIQSGNFHGPEQFSTFTYWRDSLPNIDGEVEHLLKASSSPKKSKELKVKDSKETKAA